MTERYRLDGELLPTIPVPHDGVITRLEIGGDCITFRFEEDIGRRDAIAFIHPGAKSLIIRYHLTEDGFRLYRWHRRIPLLFPRGVLQGGRAPMPGEADGAQAGVPVPQRGVLFCDHHAVFPGVSDPGCIRGQRGIRVDRLMRN